ncbi:hypothetical protein CFC21_010113 [Triticum aestivum]|uniref:Uncharacterized protein n=4 Tax=Triticinae TaxID=1648030 RepID=A0A452XPX7_AEGTS|nr:uncharacterized protein LOC120966995 [Aegilops tauschii subsp. strangulata]KAF6993186.1 hypothetical protein CFC21_010113 [Triticum aestivum]
MHSPISPFAHSSIVADKPTLLPLYLTLHSFSPHPRHTPFADAASRSGVATEAPFEGATSLTAMVNSTEPPTEPPSSNRAIESSVGEAGGTAAEAMTTSLSAHREAMSSLSSTLKMPGSHRVLRYAPVNCAGEAIAPAMGSSSQDLNKVSQRLQLGLGEVIVAPGVGNPRDNESPVVTEAVSRQPLKAHPRRRRPAMSSHTDAAAVSVPPQAPERKRRLVRADALDRPRFSATLSTEEIEEDIYALTGALPRSRPRHCPPAVQNQINLLLPGSRLSEINAESYRVPEDR